MSPTLPMERIKVGQAGPILNSPHHAPAVVIRHPSNSVANFANPITILIPNPVPDDMSAARILFKDIPYNNCMIIGCVCDGDADCRNCCVPIVMRDEARKILIDQGYY